MSGIAGMVLAPVVHGAQLWVRHINGKGGLNGHPVKLIVYDDGADPARHRAQVQEAVERRQVIGFLPEAAALSARPSVEYITGKRVPVIGTGGGAQWAYESPMYFSQASDGESQTEGWIASVAGQTVPKGKTKLGTLVCTEVQGCEDADKTAARLAASLGFQQVYRAKSSLAQPDFTAECLAAMNAGVEVFYIVLDANSTSRVAGSCVRQGFRPVIATVVTPVQDRMKEDPNLEGMLAMSHVFPWFQSGTPATDEFQGALQSFGSGLTAGVGVAFALGWTAGKLVEKAAVALPEPPTREALLAGLWSIKNDDLGGLTMPLTFVSGKPATPRPCWFDMQIQDRRWVSPDRFALHCR